MISMFRAHCLCSMLVAMLLGGSGVAAPAVAQRGARGTTSELGIGYVVNAPNMFLGVSGYALSARWGGIGLYVDAKFDIDSPRDERGFVDSLTVDIAENELGGSFFQEKDSWNSFNIAVLRPLNSQLMVYAGAGYAERERFWEYQTADPTLGFGGFYVVRHTEESGGEVNLLGGALFRIGRSLHLQFGLESTPRGVTVGVSYALPIGR